MSESVHQAREALGQRLREIRRHAGLTARQLATLAGWHESKLSRLERGTRSPTEADIRVYCEHADATNQLPDLIATLNNLDVAYVEWRRMLSTGTKRRQQASVRQAEQTKLTRMYHGTIVPGILQTAEYAEAIMRDGIEFYQIPNDVDEGVAQRMARQQFLYKGQRQFRIVIAEQALTTPVGSDDVMAGQLDRLLSIIGLPRVSFGIIPAARVPSLPATNFVMLDDRMVLVESISAELTITQPREIELYARAFDAYASRAVVGRSARALIAAAAARRTK